MTYFVQFFNTNWHTHSTFEVCGNKSKGVIELILYLLDNTSRFFAKVEGLQETYTILFTFDSNNDFINLSLNPVLGGSTTITFSYGGSRKLKNMTQYHWMNLDNPSILELDDDKSTIINYLDN